jgi:hypothetical protein
MAKEYIERDKSLLIYVSKDAYERLQYVPAADVVEVRHGRWRPHSRVETPVFHCSVCGGMALHAFGRQCKSPFCPSCGAKMDKDGDGA